MCGDRSFDKHIPDAIVTRLAESFFAERAESAVSTRVQQALRGGASHLRLVADDREIATLLLARLREAPCDAKTLGARLAALGLQASLAPELMSSIHPVELVQRGAAASYGHVEKLLAKLPTKEGWLYELSPALTTQAIDPASLGFSTAQWREELPRTAAQEVLLEGLRASHSSVDEIAKWATTAITAFATAPILGGGVLASLAIGAYLDLPSLLTGYAAALRTAALEAAGIARSGAYDDELRVLFGKYAFNLGLSTALGGAVTAVEKRVAAEGGSVLREVAKEVFIGGVSEGATDLLADWVSAGLADKAAARVVVVLASRFGRVALADSRIDLGPVWHEVMGRAATGEQNEVRVRAIDLYVAQYGGHFASLIARGELEAHFRRFASDLRRTSLAPAPVTKIRPHGPTSESR